MLLEDIADPTAVLRDEKPVLAVDQDLSVHDDAPTVRAQQSADDVDQRRLAGAGAAKQSGEPARGREARFEAERAQPVGDIDLDAHDPRTRWDARRAPNSD